MACESIPADAGAIFELHPIFLPTSPKGFLASDSTSHILELPGLHRYLSFVVLVFVLKEICTHGPRTWHFDQNNHRPLTTTDLSLYKDFNSQSLRLRASGQFVKVTEKLSMAPALRMTRSSKREATVFFCVFFF